VRDFQRLEELSDAVTIGLLAGDVVLAADRVRQQGSVDGDSKKALTRGEELLRSLAKTESPEVIALGTRSWAAAASAVEAVAAVQGQRPDADVQAVLTQLADGLHAVVQSGGIGDKQEELRAVVELFSFLGDLELAHVNNVARDREEPAAWLGTTSSTSS
jgi:hypothetical protein